MVIEKAKAHERNILEYKDHQASHRGANSMPSYNNLLLTAHALTKRRPSGWNTAIGVANLMSEATAPHMEKPVINVMALITSKPFVIQRLQQPRQRLALTKARSHSCCRGEGLLGATVGSWQRGWKASPEEEDAKEATKAESIRGYIQTTKDGPIRSDTWLRERKQ